MENSSLGMTKGQVTDALKRHEDAFQKELEDIDIRKVVLKTKKAVLEQARVNARCEQAAIDQMYQIQNIEKRIDSYIYRIQGMEKLLSNQHKVFSEAIGLLSKKEKEKGFFSRFFRWMA